MPNSWEKFWWASTIPKTRRWLKIDLSTFCSYLPINLHPYTFSICNLYKNLKKQTKNEQQQILHKNSSSCTLPLTSHLSIRGQYNIGLVSLQLEPQHHTLMANSRWYIFLLLHQFYEFDLCTVGSACLRRLPGSDLAVLVSKIGDHGLSDLVCLSELASFHRQSVNCVLTVLYRQPRPFWMEGSGIQMQSWTCYT